MPRNFASISSKILRYALDFTFDCRRNYSSNDLSNDNLALSRSIIITGSLLGKCAICATLLYIIHLLISRSVPSPSTYPTPFPHFSAVSMGATSSLHGKRYSQPRRFADNLAWVTNKQTGPAQESDDGSGSNWIPAWSSQVKENNTI